MLQLGNLDPISTVLLTAMVVVLLIWIAAELRMEGTGKSMIRVASAFILCALFMLAMYTMGLIVF